jgi:hypothetical protein
MPDLAAPWPFGLGDTDVDTDALRALLGFRITVMAGTADVSTSGRFFPKGPRSMRQEATRFERAHSYVQSGHATAAALQTSCAWAIVDVPGVGHDGSSCPPPQRHSCLRQCMHRHCEGNTTDTLSGLRLRWR